MTEPHNTMAGSYGRPVDNWRELKDELLLDLKPALDLVAAINEQRVVAESSLTVFGFEIATLKTKVKKVQ